MVMEKSIFWRSLPYSLPPVPLVFRPILKNAKSGRDPDSRSHYHKWVKIKRSFFVIKITITIFFEFWDYLVVLNPFWYYPSFDKGWYFQYQTTTIRLTIVPKKDGNTYHIMVGIPVCGMHFFRSRNKTIPWFMVRGSYQYFFHLLPNYGNNVKNKQWFLDRLLRWKK